MSRHQHGYPWPSLATPPYRPLLPAGIQSYILFRHRAAAYRFYLVVLPLIVHVKGSIGLQHLCPACLVRLTLKIFVIGGRWPYSCCFVWCNIARRILVSLLSSLFSIRLVSVHVVYPYSSIDTTAAWKKLLSILSVRSDFHMTESLSIAVHACWCLSRLMLPRYTLLKVLGYKKPKQYALKIENLWENKRKTNGSKEKSCSLQCYS